MKNPLISFLSCLIAISYSGCESKYIEKSPTEVQMPGPGVEKRAAQKISIDHEIHRFQKAIDKVGGLVNQISIYLKKDSQGEFFSLIQIASKSLKELRQGMPQYYSDEIFARYSSIKLPGSVQDACGFLNVALANYPLMKIEGDLKTKKSDRFGIFFKSCVSTEKYKPLFLIDSFQQKMNIKFVERNLKFINIDLETQFNQMIPQCNIHFSNKLEITSIDCTDIFVRVDEVHYTIIKSLKFTPSEKDVVTALVVAYENNVATGEGSVLTMSNTGQIKATSEILNEK